MGPDAKKRKNYKKKLKQKQKKALQNANGSQDESIEVSQTTDSHEESSVEPIASAESADHENSQPEIPSTHEVLEAIQTIDVSEKDKSVDLLPAAQDVVTIAESTIFDSIVQDEVPDVLATDVESSNAIDLDNAGTIDNAETIDNDGNDLFTNENLSNEPSPWDQEPAASTVAATSSPEASIESALITDPVDELFGNDDATQTQEVPWKDQIVPESLPHAFNEVSNELDPPEEHDIHNDNVNDLFPPTSNDEQSTYWFNGPEENGNLAKNVTQISTPTNEFQGKSNLKLIDTLLDDDEEDFLPSDNDSKPIETLQTDTEIAQEVEPITVTGAPESPENRNTTCLNDLFKSDEIDGSDEENSWLNTDSDKSAPATFCEDATKFSFLENDDDLLDDDDESLLDSDEEVFIPQPPAEHALQQQQASKKSYVPSDSSVATHPSNNAYSALVNPYSPQAPSLPNSISVELPNYSQNSSYSYPVDTEVPATVAPGIVKPKLINNSSFTQSSVQVANELHKKLDEAKHKTDAYDFPLDLVKQEIKRGKPVHVSSPLPSMRQPSFSTATSEKPIGLPPVRTQSSTSNGSQKPFYAELPIPQMKPTRAAPVRVSSHNDYNAKPMSPSQSISVPGQRRTSVDPPVNPYAPKKNTTSMLPAAVPNAFSLGSKTTAPILGQNLQPVLSDKNGIELPAGVTNQKSYAPPSKPLTQNSFKSTSYQPRANRRLTNSSVGSGDSFNAQPGPPMLNVAPKQCNEYSFPPLHVNTTNLPVPEQLHTKHDARSVAPVVSPTPSSSANAKRTHARSNSSVYAPANHAHSSKYAPTVHPQFQQQQQQQQQQLQQQPLSTNGFAAFPQAQVNNLPYSNSHVQPPSQPVMSALQTVNQAKHLPEQADNLYIMRRQFPIFHWGKSSKVLIGLPNAQDYISAVEPKLDAISIVSYDSILNLDKTLEQFPGPLVKGKMKTKDVSKWLDVYIEEKRNQQAGDECVLLKLLKLRLDSSWNLKAMSKVIYDSSLLLPYLSQPFNLKITPPNAHKLDTTSLVRVLTLLQTGAHDDALNLSLASKDYAMALLLGSILGKDKWSSVVDQYLTQEFEQNNERDVSSINLLSTIFQVFIGNSKKVIDCFKLDPSKLEWSLSNWKLLIACVLNNSEQISANGNVSPLVVEFLLQFGELLISKGLTIAGSIAFIVADIPISENRLIPSSSTSFEYIGSPNCFESMILSEIYEFTYDSKDGSLSGFTSLIPQKIVHAAALSDYGLNSASTKYMDAAQSMLKLLPKNSETSLKTLHFIDALSNQLSSSNVGWLGKPKLSSVWGQLDKSFNKFIGGDTDTDEPETSGVEEKVFEKFTPTSSRNPSMVDLSQAVPYLTPAPNRSHTSQLQSNNGSMIKSSAKVLANTSLSSREVKSKYGPPQLSTMKPVSKIGELYGSASNIEALNSNTSTPNVIHSGTYERPYANGKPSVSMNFEEFPSTDAVSSLAHPRAENHNNQKFIERDSSVFAPHEYSNETSKHEQQLYSPSVSPTINLPQLRKHQSSEIAKALPLETLFDETVTSGLTAESTRTAVDKQVYLTEHQEHSTVDEIVEEIDNEIDAELDELQQSEFSDDNNSEVAGQEELAEQKEIFNDDETPVAEPKIINEQPLANDVHQEGKNRVPDVNSHTSTFESPNTYSPVSSVSSRVTASKIEKAGEPGTINPYAPKANTNCRPQSSKRSYNPYSPNSASRSHSSTSQPHVSTLPCKSGIDGVSAINADHQHELTTYAYGNYGSSSQNSKAYEPYSPAAQTNESKPLSLGKSFSTPTSYAMEENNILNAQSHELPPHLYDGGNTLPLSEIKDPVIRPVQTSHFTPHIVDDTNTEEYYDDVVEDTEDEDEDIKGDGKQLIAGNSEITSEFSSTLNQKRNEEDEVENVSEDDDDKKDQKKKKDQSSSGWLGWFKKDPNEKKPIKAKLGNKNNFYYDENLKRWINKNATEEEKVKVETPPPPPPVVKRKLSKTPEIKPRQGSIMGGPALRTAHAVMPTNPLTGKPLDPVKDFTDSATSKPEPVAPSLPPMANNAVNLSGPKANGLDDLMALAGGSNIAPSTRRKKKSTRGYVNVMENM